MVSHEGRDLIAKRGYNYSYSVMVKYTGPLAVHNIARSDASFLLRYRIYNNIFITNHF